MWMQSAMVIITHILLPLLFIGGIAAGRLNSAFDLLASVVLATAFLTLIHHIGGWFLLGTFWPKLFWLLLIVAVVLALRQRLPSLPRWPPRRRQWLQPGIALLVSAFLASALPSILTARSVPAGHADRADRFRKPGRQPCHYRVSGSHCGDGTYAGGLRDRVSWRAGDSRSPSGSCREQWQHQRAPPAYSRRERKGRHLRAGHV